MSPGREWDGKNIDRHPGRCIIVAMLKREGCGWSRGYAPSFMISNDLNFNWVVTTTR